MNEKLERFYADIKDKRVAVIGLGVSNLPVIDFLLSAGATVIGRDRKTREALGILADALEEKGVVLHLGDTYLDGIDADVIFKSPGIRPDVPALLAAVERGTALTSEMEVFLALCPAKVFAVTGSDGKTTTTTLIYKMLSRQVQKDRESGAFAEKARPTRVFVGGNIGRPLLPEIADMTEDDYVVLELSSFQLQAMMTHRDMRAWPDVACVTNVTPNHLNWHTDMDEYIRAKAEIFAHQDKDGRLVVNYGNETARKMAEGARGHKTVFSSGEVPTVGKDGDAAIFVREGVIYACADACEEAFPVLAVDDIFIPGKHNVENYMTAIAAVRGYVDVDTIFEIASTFGGVEHRQEYVCTRGGIKYYNSSIDSSPTRTLAALSAFRNKPIVILGGADKGVSFDVLAEPLSLRAKAIVLTGAARDKIQASLNTCAAFRASGVPIKVVPDFYLAIDAARDFAKEGDTVILSPACTSFDAFSNFEARGAAFKAHVMQYED